MTHRGVPSEAGTRLPAEAGAAVAWRAVSGHGSTVRKGFPEVLTRMET